MSDGDLVLLELEDPLARAKLTVPRLRPGTVNRAKLAGVVQDQRPALVAVCAPAGYGKTSLLVQWAGHDSRKVAWLSLDRADNDPVALLGSLARVIQALAPLERTVADELATPGVSLLGRVVPRLAAALRVSPDPFLLLLDDIHEVENRECRDAINLLIEHLPSGSTLAASSRTEPWLNLARRRAQGDVLEVGPRQLAFDGTEAAKLLANAAVQLQGDATVQLLRRTEGWPAGLYLAALAIRDGVSQASPPELLPGNDRFVADYLRAEILDRHPGQLRQFLTRTSVLNQLCGPLCDQTLAASGSAEGLSALAQSNLFLIPLDHHRGWYRYHPLFRDLLKDELLRLEPELVPELHRRAADWYEMDGRAEEAIPHAHASGDRDRAARLVAMCFLPAYISGRLATAEEWLRAFTPAEMERHPMLAALAALQCALTGRPIEAARWAEIVERSSIPAASPSGSASFGSAPFALRAVMCPNGVAAMVADAERAASEEPPWSPWRCSVLIALVAARLAAHESESAETALAELIETAEATDDSALIWALSERGLAAMSRGDWQHAARDVERARTRVIDLGRQEYLMSAMTFAASARLAIHHGNLPAAREEFAHAMRLRLLATWALPTLAVGLRSELIKVCVALGDPAGAYTLLRETDQIRQHRPDLGLYLDRIDSLRDQVSTLPTGSAGASALTAAELRLLPYLQTHLSYREVGQRLYVSANTVRTQAQAIYHKLHVSSRSAAVDRARQLGLLAG